MFNVTLKILNGILNKELVCRVGEKPLTPEERPNVKMLIRHVFMEESNSKFPL